MPSEKRAAEQDITSEQAKRARTTNIDDLTNEIVKRYKSCNYRIADLFEGQLERLEANNKALVGLSTQNSSRVVTPGFDDLQKQERERSSLSTVGEEQNAANTNNGKERARKASL